MADNALKTPLVTSLDAISKQRAGDANAILGKDLPCHVVSRDGQLVTVAFDIKSPFTPPQVTIPIDSNLDDWLPIQPNDKGVARSADVYLGGVSGQGGGTADLLTRANLSMLVFHPTTNKSQTPPGGGDKDDRIVVGRKKGVMLVTLDDHGNVKTKCYVDNQGTMTVTGDLHVTGEIVWKSGSDNTHASTHTHNNTFTGGGNTNKPNAGT